MNSVNHVSSLLASDPSSLQEPYFQHHCFSKWMHVPHVYLVPRGQKRPLYFLDKELGMVVTRVTSVLNWNIYPAACQLQLSCESFCICEVLLFCWNNGILTSWDLDYIRWHTCFCAQQVTQYPFFPFCFLSWGFSVKQLWFWNSYVPSPASEWWD